MWKRFHTSRLRSTKVHSISKKFPLQFKSDFQKLKFSKTLQLYLEFNEKTIHNVASRRIVDKSRKWWEEFCIHYAEGISRICAGTTDDLFKEEPSLATYIIKAILAWSRNLCKTEELWSWQMSSKEVKKNSTISLIFKFKVSFN